MITVKDEQFITISEACSFLGLGTVEGFRRWRQRNGIPCFKIGRYTYVRKSDIENALLSAPSSDRGKLPFVARREGNNTYRYLMVDKNGYRSSLRVTYVEGSTPSRDAVKALYQNLREKSTDLPHDLLQALREKVGETNIINAIIG